MSAARHNESDAGDILGVGDEADLGDSSGADEHDASAGAQVLPSGSLLSPSVSQRSSGANGVSPLSNVPTVARGLARGLVLARASRTAADAAIHGQLVGLGGSRIEQIASLEYRLTNIASRRGSPADRAQEVLALLRQLMARETGTPHLDDALPLFFRRLSAESHIQSLVLGLVKDATAAVASGRVSERFGTPGRVAESLDFLLGWYVRRTASLQALEDLSVGDDHEECLFNIRVTHDAAWAGEPGVEVSCGLRLLGRSAQPLWLKLFVRSEGRPVAPREGFQQWVDDTEPLLVSSEEAAGRVAAVMQLTPTRQRQIVDRASLFLPYASMLLPAGSREVELELGLFDEHGFPVFEASQLETLSIPRRSQQELALAQPGVVQTVRLPSPQALGLWGESPISGTRIQNASVRVVARESSSASASGVSSSTSAVQMSFDMVLCGHVSETLFIESRVLERNGTAVKATSESDALPRTSFSLRQEIHPESAFQVLREANLQFSTRALALEPGQHDLLLEITLLGSDDRVVVGTLVPLMLTVAPAALLPSESGKLRTTLSLSEQLIGLQMRSFTADPGHDLSAQRRRTIRVESVVKDERGARTLLRVKGTIESSDGRVLLADTVLVPADSMTREFRYVSHFDERTIIAMLAHSEIASVHRGEALSTAVIGPQKLLARVEWCSSEDESLLSNSVTVTLAGHLSSTTEAATAEVVSDEARIIDVSFCAPSLINNVGIGIPPATIAWLVPAHEVGGNLPCIFAELLDAAGEPLAAEESHSDSNEGGSLRGSIVRADPALREFHIRRGGQVLCSLPLLAGAEDWKNAHQLKLMSFSASGRVTQVVTAALPKAPPAPVKPSAIKTAGTMGAVALKNSGSRDIGPGAVSAKESSPQTAPQSWLQRILG